MSLYWSKNNMSGVVYVCMDLCVGARVVCACCVVMYGALQEMK